MSMIDPPTRTPVSPGEFEELLVARQHSLLNFIKSLVANHHEAEDLLQRTNLILWQKRNAFEAGSNFRAWAFTIARLEALNHLRQHRRDRRVFAEQREDPAAEGRTEPAGDGDTDALVALRDCVRRLPPRDRELLMMRYGTDCTLHDYAKNLDRSPGTLKARLFKIREALRKNLEARLGESDRAIFNR